MEDLEGLFWRTEHPVAGSVLSQLFANWVITITRKEPSELLEVPETIPTEFLSCPFEIFPRTNQYHRCYFQIISFPMQDPRHGKHVRAESNSFLWQMFLFGLVFPQNKATVI